MHTLFDTAIGRCAVAWGDAGITAVRLPDSDDHRTAHGLGDPADPPPEIRAAVARMRALLDGGSDDLADIALDPARVPDFHQRVYAVTRSIPPGQTLTYGEVAAAVGMPGSAQAVGQALGRNPYPIIVPCHRVLAASGKLTGFSAPGGTATKLRMLTIEGAAPNNQPSLF